MYSLKKPHVDPCWLCSKVLCNIFECIWSSAITHNQVGMSSVEKLALTDLKEDRLSQLQLDRSKDSFFYLLSIKLWPH